MITIAIRNAEEEMVLSVRVKMRLLTTNDLIEYFGARRLGLSQKLIQQVINTLAVAKGEWFRLISIRFLAVAMKVTYMKLLTTRWNSLGIDPR